MNPDLWRLIISILAFGIVVFALHFLSQFLSRSQADQLERRRLELEERRLRLEESTREIDQDRVRRALEIEDRRENLLNSRAEIELRKAELDLHAAELQLRRGEQEKLSDIELLKKIKELENALAQREQEISQATRRWKEFDDEEGGINFTAYCPTILRPGEWKSLLSYAHIPEALALVQADSKKQIGSGLSDYSQAATESKIVVERGAAIAIVPRMPGVTFNPETAALTWLEDWHRLEFRMQATANKENGYVDRPIRGRISFFVGPILIAELPIQTEFRIDDALSNETPMIATSTEPYHAVFVSYSHEDKLIVDCLEEAYKVLGMSYLRDVNILRSGEDWDTALLGKIDEANIFQLCWSSHAKQSAAVEREWRHALEKNRRNFVRPVYWEEPMPQPPHELKAIHFAKLNWLRFNRREDQAAGSFQTATANTAST